LFLLFWKGGREIMPNLKTAKKNLRKSKKRAVANKQYENKIDLLLKKMKKEAKKGSQSLKELVKSFYKVVDKAAKKNIIHKNKANRLKSKTAKLIKK
jgi:small subunit ribosomal protein S20